MSPERRPEAKFSRPPAPVKRRQWETEPTIDPLVVLLVTKNTPNGGVQYSAKNAYPTDEFGCRQQALFFLLEWATFVPQKPQNHTSAGSKGSQALRVFGSMAPKEVF